MRESVFCDLVLKCRRLVNALPKRPAITYRCRVVSEHTLQANTSRCDRNCRGTDCLSQSGCCVTDEQEPRCAAKQTGCATLPPRKHVRNLHDNSPQDALRRFCWGLFQATPTINSPFLFLFYRFDFYACVCLRFALSFVALHVQSPEKYT